MRKNLDNSFGDSSINGSMANLRFKGISQRMHHRLNPMHFPYCRLRDLGLNKKSAKSLSILYENIIFKTFFNNGHGKSRVSKLLKTLKDYFSYEAEDRF